MPRGPGKKENYNLDYSRFNKYDHLDDEDDNVKLPSKTQDEADAAGGMPPPEVQEMLRNVPPELQEAYRLMALAKANGNEEAHRRASELAIAAVQKGDPQVKNQFIQNMAKEMPDVAARLTKELNNQGPNADPAKVLANISQEVLVEEEALRKAKAKGEDSDDVLGRVSSLQEKMKAGAEATRKQLEAMEKQRQELETIKSPEDFFKFMHGGGLSEEDLQRCFSGDQSHMEACMSSMLDKAAAAPDGKVADAEQAIKAVEELHGAICGDGPAEVPENTPEEQSKPSKASPAPKVEEPPVLIPEYRLQYERDAAGKYTSVELKCSLPGVTSMASIVLDVSEKHLRLSTVDPAPRYVVNAGPFPVLIDAQLARAKYSKKREELSVSVPAKIES